FLSKDPRDVAKINELKREAERAFLDGSHQIALDKYVLLRDSLGVDEDEIKLNIAHAQYQLDDTASAKSSYSRLSTSTNKQLQSIAYQQLGVMSKENGKLDVALQQLKSAIKADPTNQEARYNYEVVKKLLEEQENQDQQNQDQENQDQENQDQEEQQENEDQENQENQENQEDQESQGDQENEENQEQEGEQQENGEEKEGEEQENQEQQAGEEGEEEEQEKTQEQMTQEKLEEMNISEEKAKMILEAMKNNEIQYLQQQRRKATERPPSDKPDW
ncbi:MAG: hypothetical protein AAGA66_18155, partial [Bacteroidota bacterium]